MASNLVNRTNVKHHFLGEGKYACYRKSRVPDKDGNGILRVKNEKSV
jgi:hypothetical protein